MSDNDRTIAAHTLLRLAQGTDSLFLRNPSPHIRSQEPCIPDSVCGQRPMLRGVSYIQHGICARSCSLQTLALEVQGLEVPGTAHRAEVNYPNTRHSLSDTPFLPSPTHSYGSYPPPSKVLYVHDGCDQPDLLDVHAVDPTAFIICCDKPVCQPVGYTSEECFAALGLLTLASSQPAAATISPVPGPYEAQESSSVVRYATVEDDPFFTALEELCDPDGSSKTSLEPMSPLAHLTPLLDTSISLSSLAGDQEDNFWEGDSFDTFVQDGPLTLSDSEDGFSTSNDWKLVVEEKEYAPRCHGQDEDVEMCIEDGVFQAWESGREWEGNHSPTYNEDDDDQRCTGAAQYDFLLDCDMDASGMGFDHVMKEVMDPGSDWAQTLFTF